MEILGVDIHWLGHASFKIEKGQKIFIDPFQLRVPEKDADVILITHDHFDHCSIDDIRKLANQQAVIIAAKMCRAKIDNLKSEVAKIIYFMPGDKIKVNNASIEAVPAYNVNKFRAPGVVFHPKEMGYVGYVIEIDKIRIYHAGDTDFIPEMNNLGRIDIAMLPIGGTYTMNVEEAVEAVKAIKPKYTIPMHYGSIVGSEKDAEKFEQLASAYTKVVLMKKE
jgi:L-ascorbate metabolism protein UlaG (beta-lactamase superfamily)